MYMRYFKDKVMDDPYPIYQNCSELIEADGEAIDAWLDIITDEQYPSERFTVTDWKNDDTIDLDIIDYIGQKVYDNFAEIVYRAYDDDDKLSRVKMESFYLACLQNTCREQKKRRCKTAKQLNKGSKWKKY